MLKTKMFRGASADALLLLIIKLVTAFVGFVITRLLSEYLSVFEYGTYSQVMLIVSTVASLTILGMMDGVNYFYCSEVDAAKRETYVATLFSMQCIISAIAGVLIFALTKPLCAYFDNHDLARLMFFAAVLPLFQNLLCMFQVLLVSVGKARMLAIRNLAVSLARLIAVVIVITVAKNIAVIFFAIVLLDGIQTLLFVWLLKKCGCPINLRLFDPSLLREIFSFCAPMAIFIILGSLSRDCDKYLIAWMTDTETLAMYSNASRSLPFDMIILSFCTILRPQLTQAIVDENSEKAAGLYKALLEIGYIPTGILCCVALAASPQLMTLLYSEKYISGLSVFCVYILVDMFRFTNITLVLSAAGKTRKLMFLGLGSLAANALLNVLLYWAMGVPGPAVATLVTTIVTGGLMISFSAREMQAVPGALFEWKHLVVFILESAALTVMLHFLQTRLDARGMHYLVILLLVGVLYGGAMLLLQGNRLYKLLKRINEI